jgi:hypothetical protein
MRLLSKIATMVMGVAAVGVFSPTAAHASQPPLYGCDAGYVCIYPQDVSAVDYPHPSLKYYTYGPHNLSNQYGYHHIVNNQTGFASFTLCTGYNGRGCTDGPYGAINMQYVDLTPINSIRLDP